jgi:hypothetical protein
MVGRVKAMVGSEVGLLAPDDEVGIGVSVAGSA